MQDVRLETVDLSHHLGHPGGAAGADLVRTVRPEVPRQRLLDRVKGPADPQTALIVGLGTHDHQLRPPGEPRRLVHRRGQGPLVAAARDPVGVVDAPAHVGVQQVGDPEGGPGRTAQGDDEVVRFRTVGLDPFVRFLDETKQNGQVRPSHRHVTVRVPVVDRVRAQQRPTLSREHRLDHILLVRVLVRALDREHDGTAALTAEWGRRDLERTRPDPRARLGPRDAVPYVATLAIVDEHDLPALAPHLMTQIREHR